MGLVRVAERRRELGERWRMRRAELDRSFVEAVALDDSLRRDADVCAEAALEHALVEIAGAGEVVDAQDGAIEGDALDEIAEAFEALRRPLEKRREQCFGERDLLLRYVRCVERARPASGGCAEDLHERHDAIGDALHRGAEERLEHHRAEADAERLLVEGMQDLAAQVHWASEGSKLALDRVLGVSQAPSPVPSSTATFADLHASVDGAIGYLEAVDPAALEAGLDRVIELPMRGRTTSYRGDRFLVEFALPNFFFHLTLAYAILRKEGAPLEKGDFMGA